MFWIGILYFAEGFPLGVFYDVFPVHFRQQGVDLREIGFLSLLGLAWTLKFLWAPAIDHFRHHRRWMFGVDLLMACVMLAFAIHADFGPWVWIAIAFYRVGMLASGFILILTDWLGWAGTYTAGAAILLLAGIACLNAPRELVVKPTGSQSWREEWRGLLTHPAAFAAVIAFLLGTVWLINRTTQWSAGIEYFWAWAALLALLLFAFSMFYSGRSPGSDRHDKTPLREGPMFGALLEMLQRPYIVPVILFILIFKLGDSAMGFMIKPFWVDSGFSATQIGLVSVNIGLALSIAGGIVGGLFTDRMGIFRGLWILGLLQAGSNLGYAWVAAVMPAAEAGAPVAWHFQTMMYSASALESFCGGLGTAAFLAFLMSIVDKRHSATEYALLSSIFALSRSVSGWAGGYGATAFGYADYFMLTFFLAFPAYLLLPWVRKMMRYTDKQHDWVKN
jgi:PAT family beta-lactamase induction signal transducer AmpG